MRDQYELFSIIFVLVVFSFRKMCENSISKFVDSLDVNSRMYYVLILFLGITVFATRYILHELNKVEEIHFVQEQNRIFLNTWMFSSDLGTGNFVTGTP